MIGIPLGLAYANAFEWLMHKYGLHGLGRNKKSFWSFHWHDHHKAARQNDMRDPAYEEKLFTAWNPQTKEVVSLIAGGLVHLPLLPVAPFFVGTVWYSSIKYYHVHKKAHLDPEWAKEHLPWHYDHHMAPDQDCNWCVTKPWTDVVLGTRKKWFGTDEEKEARKQREAFLRRRAEAEAEREASAKAA